MTLYEKFKRLEIDFSQLSLEQGDTRSGYFCTPKGAEVIGWAGVDGIHYCFVKGFGETVFAVNPSNLPGDHVHPVARSFEDFLRLVLACGGEAALEQARLWDREGFNAFLWECDPPTPEQEASLAALRDKLCVTPMEDPYGYIREVQASFDYSKIPYRKDYYDCVPESPKAPERPEWKVYFEGGFSSRHAGRDRPGKEIPVGKTFTWGGRVWHIPAVYFCGKGLVADLCVEIDPADLRAFLEKWMPRIEGGGELSQEEREQQMAENPMTVDFTPKATVNGRELRRRSGNGFGWTPVSCRTEEQRGEPNQQDWEGIWLMEHYGFDPERGWMFWRESFPWATKTKPTVKTVTLVLAQQPISVPGPRFTVSGAGDSVPFTHPVTGEIHTLHVVEYEAQEMDASHFQDEDRWEYPIHYDAMSFAVEPELPRQSLAVRDCGQGDRPQLKQPDMVGPAVASSVGVILATGKSGQPRAACSSLYFEPPEHIEWRLVFYQKTIGDIELDLLP